MLKTYHVFLIYLVMIIFYFSRGVVYSGGESISILATLLVIVISLVYLFKSIADRSIKKSFFYWTWFSFLLLNMVMVFLSSLDIIGVFNDVSIGNFKGIIVVSLSFFPVYYFTQKNVAIEKYFSIFFIVMLIISTIEFYNFKESTLLERGIDGLSFVNNLSYSFVYLFPFLYFIREKRVMSFLCMLFMIFMTIQGAKRGAIISVICASFIYYIFYMKSISRNNRYILLFPVITSLLGFLYYLFSENEFVLDRLAEEGGSGRDIIYSNLLSAWANNGNILNFLFGYGFSSTLQLSGTGLFAHSDWLELLINYGILGILIYFSLFVLLIKYALDFKQPSYIIAIISTIIVIWSLTSLISMNYMNPRSILQSMLLAYLFSRKELSKTNNLSQK